MTAPPAYPPSPYRETRLQTIVEFIRGVGFGQLVTVGDARPYVTNVPFLLRQEGESVVLEAHLQRGNPQWRSIAGEALALFQGPHAYIHPGWYETKKQDGRAVPTWNYIAVQAVGAMEIVDDPDWLRTHLAALTNANEAGRPDPWTLADAPSGYIDALLRGIVGVRLTVREFDGRWKLNQNHPEANRLGVIEGLAASHGSADREIAALMARLEAERR